MNNNSRDEKPPTAGPWQIARLRELIRRIEQDGFEEATQDQIDAAFTPARD